MQPFLKIPFVSSAQVRYDRVNSSAETRNHHVNSGYNELQKFDREFSSFETWLRSAERTLDAYLMDVARDREAP